MTSVLIIENSYIVQLGLSTLIKNNGLFDRIVSVKNGSKAIKHIREDNNAFDMIILDINLGGMSVFQFVELVRTTNRGIPFMFFTKLSTGIYVKRLIDIGVKGFVNKFSNDDEIVKAIHTVVNGGRYYSEDALEALSINSSENHFGKLSKREVEIMHLLIEDRSQNEICEITCLHKSSVATYKNRIFTKLRVKGLVELFQLALNENIVQLDQSLAL